MERRLSAILAADMVGYSRLMERDETATLARQKQQRQDVFDPAIETYRGRVIKLMGDGILVEFSSVVDAVQCAVSIQRTIAKLEADKTAEERIEHRIGINLGDVVFDDGDLFGDGVNIAARLEQMADPGGICLSGTTFDHLKTHVDVTYEPLGEIKVKNLRQPVRAYRVLMDDTPNYRRAGKRKSTTWLRSLATAMVCVTALIGAGAWWWASGAGWPTVLNLSTKTSVSRPSIAVLPFVNLSEDDAEDYFVDGISEDIATDLSRVDGLDVTARSATLRFRDSTLGPVEIGEELGVNHLLEGSIRRLGDRVRITAKLVSASSGDQIWAQRYDREMQNVFEIQDEIAGHVVTQLEETFIDVSLMPMARGYTPDVEAYDAYIRGRAQRIPPTPPNLQAALASFDRAISLDPDFAGGYAGASFTHILMFSDARQSAVIGTDHLERALALANEAVELDPTFGPAWGSLAEANFRERNYEEALEAVKKAITLSPSDSLMRARYGRYLGHIGRSEEGLAEVKAAMRMSPDSLPMLYFLGTNFRSIGDYESAISSLVEHRELLGGRVLPGPTTQLIAAYMQAGKEKKAKAEVKGLLKTAPDYTARQATRTHPYQDPEEEREFLNALIEAGLPA